MKKFVAAFLLMFSLAAFAQEPAPPPPTLTAEEQAWMEATINLYLATKKNSEEVIINLAGTVANAAGSAANSANKVETFVTRLEAVETNAPQWINSAKIAEANSAASATAAQAAQNKSEQLYTQVQNLLIAFGDQLKLYDERIKKLEAAIPAPVPVTKTVMAWRASATGTWSTLQSAVIPTSVNIQTLTPAFAVPTNIKTVTYFLDNNATGWTETGAPYDYRGGQTTFSVGTHTLKQTVLYTDGSTENLLVTFTVK